MNVTKRERILGGLWGALVGDALGVPVEFRERASVQANPVKEMRGHGTHDQPPGTWSDDGALMLCTVDSLLLHDFDVQDMGERFVRWMHEGLWTARGEVFDIGTGTKSALKRIASGIPAEDAGGIGESNNGNGSLMRILPGALRFAGSSTKELADCVSRISAITHAHVRSEMSCALYGMAVRHLLTGSQPVTAVQSAQTEFVEFYGQAPELPYFTGVLKSDLAVRPEHSIRSTGYVLDTLEASLWCLLTTTSFADCVLKAVNLGGDTDTTGCVTGGLAGVHYGLDAIPKEWLSVLPRRDEVGSLFNRFADKLDSSGSDY